MLNQEKIIMSVFGKLAGGEANHYPTVRLTKLSDGENPKYPKDHPRHIKDGSVAEGLMVRPVTVGESFYVNHLNAKNHYHTSVVQEILSDNTFRTQNSIYKWEIIKP